MTPQEKIEDIKSNPDNHRHDYSGLLACCFVNGAIDTMIMDAHEGLVAGNAKCDVVKGPCSCGAWH